MNNIIKKAGIRKKFTAFIIFVVLLASTVPFNLLSAEASTEFSTQAIPDFQIYNADARLGWNGQTESIYDVMMNSPMIYSTIGEYIINDKNIQFTSTLWNTFFNEQLHENIFQHPQYYYEVILMDWLAYNANTSDIKNLLAQKETDYMIKVYGTLSDIITESDPDFIKNANEIERFKELTKEQVSFYIGKSNLLDDLPNVLGDISDIASSSTDYIEKLSTALAVNEAKTEQIEFLKRVKESVRQSGENPAFVKAAEDVIEKYEQSPISLTAGVTAQKILISCITYAWDTICEISPIGWFLKTIDIGKATLDVLFNNSEKADNNFRLISIYCIDKYFRDTLEEHKNNFMNDKTTDNAATFNGAFESYMEFQIYASNFTKGFIKAIVQEGAASNIIWTILGEHKTYEDIVNTTNTLINNRITVLNLVTNTYKLYCAQYYKNEFIDDLEDLNNYTVNGISTQTQTIEEKYLDYVIKDGGAIIRKYKGYYINARIPESVEGFPVIKIKDNAFGNENWLENLYIPETVQEIGSYAFSNCTSLNRVRIANANITIKDKAFHSSDDTILNVTLLGATGSTIESYAKSYNHMFAPLDWDGKTKTQVIPEGNIYYIHTPAELAWIASQTNSGNSFEGKIVRLMFDMELNEYNWTPIGTEQNPFKGSFNGGNYTIYNLKVASGSKIRGLFGNVVSDNSIYFKNTKFSNVNITIGDSTVGTLIGKMQSSTNGNIEIKNNIVSTSSFRGVRTTIGGLIGTIVISDGQINIENNVVDDITVFSKDFAFNLYHGYNHGTQGGLIGYIEASNSNTTIRNCSTNGTLTTGAGPAGGLIGAISNTSADSNGRLSMYRCYSNSVVTAKTTYGYNCSYAGGLLGNFSGEKLHLSQCGSTKDISSTGYNGSCGGLVAVNNDVTPSDIIILDSYTIGNVSALSNGGYTYSGGILATSSGQNIRVSNCYYNGTMVARVAKGGILSNGNASTEITGSYCNSGNSLIGKDTGATITNSNAIEPHLLTQQKTFDGWNFDSIWQMNADTNYGLPTHMVNQIKSTNIKITGSGESVAKGNSIALTAQLTPKNSTDSIVWESSDNDVATVSNGTVIGISKGEAIITATTSAGLSAEYKIKVIEYNAESIDILENEIKLNKHDKYTFNISCNPSHATDSLQWTSSNPEVAKVLPDNSIHVLKSGKATITVSTEDGVSDSCVVNVPEYVYIVNDDLESITLIQYNGASDVLNIPKSYDGYKITAIGTNTFSDATFESIKIPDTVTTIQNNAFPDCLATKTIYLGKNTNEIDANAFVGCNDVTIYGYENSYAQQYAKENGFRFVPYSSPATNPEDSMIPDDSYPEQPLPETNDDPSDQSHPNAGDILKDNINSALYQIIGFDGELAKVSYYQPVNANQLSVTIPDTVILENGIKAKVTTISAKAFKECKKLKKVVIGNNVKTICKEAFSNCINLKTIKLGSSVTTIETKAFYKNRTLEKIVIPPTVTRIGSKTFYGCRNLKMIRFTSKKVPKVTNDTFKNLNTKKITVQISKAMNKNNFNRFKKILEKRGFYGKIKWVK